MKRKVFPVLLALFLLLPLALPAAADVAYLPKDSFLEKHMDECRYENRFYYTNGDAGYVLAHTTPDSAEATPLPNGGRYLISNVYQDRWGILEYDPNSLGNVSGWGEAGRKSGWVDLNKMTPDYDYRAFAADHAAELVDESKEFRVDGQDKTVYAYKYPGSGEVVGWFEGVMLSDPITLSPLFTDPAGRLWGFCGYYLGRRNSWICIDDPCNGALAPDENRVSIVINGGTISNVPSVDPTETPAPSDPPAPAPTVTPAPTAAPAPDPTQTPEPAPDPTQTPEPAPDPAKAPAETPAPAPIGKTIEITPPADAQTLEDAARASRGSGPYVAAGAAGIVVVAAAVLIAALRKKKR